MSRRYPIKHWSHSSLVGFLSNPLAWYKRYVEGVYDTLSSPSSIVGRAGHAALEHFYKGGDKETALEAIRKVQPELARGVSKGVLHKNTAARKFSRLTRRIAALG